MHRISSFIANFSLVLFPAGILGVKLLSGGIFLLVVVAGLGQMFINKELFHLSRDEKILFFSVSFLAVSTYIVTFLNDTSLGRANLFVGLILVIPIYTFFKKNLKTDKYLWYGLVLGAFVSLFSMKLEGIYGNRAAGATHPILFGDLALLIGVLSLAGFIYFKKKKNRIFLLFPILAFSSGLIASALSMSRGGWVAIPALAIIFIWYFSRHLPVKKILAICAFLIMTVGIIYMVPQSGVKNRVEITINNIDRYFESQEVSDQSRGTSIGSRFEMWKASWIIFKEHPIIGGGWGEYKANAQKLMDKGIVNSSAAGYVHPHNQFISSLAKGGIVGLVGTIIIFLFPAIIFYNVVKDNSRLEIQYIGLAGLVLIVAFVIFNMSESLLERTRTVMFFSFYLSVFMALINVLIRNEKE